MSAPGDIESLRAAAGFLVRAAEREAQGSTMTAYDDVAREIGASSSWFRKFVRGYDGVTEPGWSLGCRIVEKYSRACERVELLIARDRAMNQKLTRDLNEIVESAARARARAAAESVSARSPLGGN